MTDKEVMQQALECIERLNMRGRILADFEDEVYAAISALKAALEQPAQESVAFYHPQYFFYRSKRTHISAPTVVDVEPLPLYAAPPAAQRPWQGLTDEEIRRIKPVSPDLVDFRSGVRCAEAAHGIKE